MFTGPRSIPSPQPLAVRAGLAVATLAALLVLASCGTLDDASRRITDVIRPYRADMIQGNLISKEQVALLKTGMSRNQVRDVLGSPLLTSVFHGDRWDYAFTIRRQGVPPMQRKLTVYFKDDALQRFEGDEMPSEAEFVAQVDSRPKSNKPAPSLQADEATLQAVAAKATPASSPALTNTTALPSASAQPARYPPLEAASAAPSSAWDAPTQHAAAAATATRAPSTPPGNAPRNSAVSVVEQEVSAFVNQWTADWQARNPAQLLSHYTAQFNGGGARRAEWAAQISQRLEKASNITLSVTDLRVRTNSANAITVTFTQALQIDATREVGTKTLELVKRDGRWLIERESFTPAR